MKLSKQEVIQAIEIINDLAFFATIHGHNEDALLKLINVLTYLQDEFNIEEDELNV